MQVLSLRVVEGVPPEEVAARLTAVLPPGVGVVLSRRAGARFNASWQASGKEYRYRLALSDLPAWSGCAWRVDVRPERVAEELLRAVGTRNFAVFHDGSSVVKPRTVRSATVHELASGLVEVRVTGDGFARHMVRRLVGAAVGVARGEVAAETYVLALEEARRSPGFAGRKAPAQGLVLWEVSYPPEIDPFTAAERRAPPGLPETPPFAAG